MTFMDWLSLPPELKFGLAEQPTAYDAVPPGYPAVRVPETDCCDNSYTLKFYLPDERCSRSDDTKRRPIPNIDLAQI